MKITIKLLVIFLTTIILTNCQKPDNLNDGTSQKDAGLRKMSDLLISDNFSWRTTSDINIKITLPSTDNSQVVSISDNEDNIIFEGYGDFELSTLSTVITIPSYIKTLRINYGFDGIYPEKQVSAASNINIDFSQYSSAERSVCGCDDGIRELSMVFNGSDGSLVEVKENSSSTLLFSATLNNGDLFSFTGSGSDNKMDEMINFYIDANYNATIITDCSITVEAGDEYGSFIIQSGITDNFVPLCNKIPGSPRTIGFTGTLAYEDLWPSEGDYDFNDMVISYDFDITKNPLEEIEKIDAQFTIYALGASFYNGFGFELEGVNPDQISSVSGYTLKSNSIVSLLTNGVEAAQSKANIIVFDDCFDVMQHPGVGTGINTESWTPYVAPVTLNMQINFIEGGVYPPGGAVTFRDLNIGHFNPYLFVNQERGKEIHLPYYTPTNLANTNYFGQWDDDSNPATGRYYLTENNYPWAINIPEVFDYPLERIDINNAYNYFKDWSESDGQQYTDWFKNSTGYRNSDFVYPKPQ